MSLNRIIYSGFIGGVLLLVTAFVVKGQNVNVFGCAHPYDWQLFMNPNAFDAVNNQGGKVLFIHLTSGDDGNGVNNKQYLAKEEGIKRGIRHMSNAFGSGSGIGSEMNHELIVVNNHSVDRYQYRNAIIYTLRLPTAKENGEGYEMHQFKSIQKLFNGENQELATIDNKSTYNGVDDLKTTLSEIIARETTDNDLLIYHLIDDDENENPTIHSDRLYTTKLFKEVAEASKFYLLNLYKSVSSKTEEANVQGTKLLNSFGAWGATCSGVSDSLFASDWNPENNSLIERQYYRTANPKGIDNENIALNKTTFSSSFETNSESKKAVDGDINSWWGANPHGEWWMVDLEDTYEVSRINLVNYFQSQRVYRYYIEASLDKENWQKIIDYSKNENTSTSAGATFHLDNEKCRYLKVTMTYHSQNVGVHINEFRAFGKKVNDTQVAISEQKTSIQLYPNPVKKGENLYVIAGNNKNSIIEIYSLTGSCVYQRVIEEETPVVNISLQTIRKGVYIFFIRENGRRKRELLIIK
ncbi:T9SS type A sorting domain-containing protein [Prolixibacteraceae bacterium JC049]|nr:T9SS type A sorting domain-containing protein [Prolixibacteraceae bacterium JC049]